MQDPELVNQLKEKLPEALFEKLSGSLSIDRDRLRMLELEPGVSSAEVEAESQRDQLQLPLRVARKHPGRQELPADLPRVERIIACTPEQCVCGKCGKQTDRIGYESSEQLDVEPAKYFVRARTHCQRAFWLKLATTR
jgi:transposase